MIVIGINIALWFEGWFNDLEDAETEQQYLAGLLDDLRTDINQLETAIEFNSDKLEKLGEIIPALPSLPGAGAEARASAIFAPSSDHFFEPSDFTYRSMQESGDFRLLSDADTKTRLLKLVRQYRRIDTLQQNFMQALDDGYIPLLMTGFDIMAQRVTDPGFLENQLFRNFFPYTYQEVETRLAFYRSAQKQAQQLVEIIEVQVSD